MLPVHHMNPIDTLKWKNGGFRVQKEKFLTFKREAEGQKIIFPKIVN